MHQDILLFVVGGVVGAMNAIAGGGMLIGFPVMLALGIPPLIANATTNIVVLPGNISAAFAYRKYLKRVPPQYLLLLIPVAVGAAVGATALRNTSSDGFEQLAPWLILFAVILFAFQPFLHLQIHRHLHGPKRRKQSMKPLIFTGLAIIPVAMYGGFFGAGFGFIMLAFLGFTKLHDHLHRINALKSLMTICISTVALFCLLGANLIDWRHGLIMAGGNLIGGYVAAIGTQKVSSHVIRIIVIVIGLTSAIYLAISTYNP